MLPAAFYKLSARDRAGPLVSALLRTVQTDSAAAALNADFVVPADQVLVLDHIGVRGQGGGGQTVTAVSVSVMDTGLTNMMMFNLRTGLATADETAFTQVNSLWIPPGATLRAAATFSAGVAVNTTRLFLGGVLIPRGNFPTL